MSKSVEQYVMEEFSRTYPSRTARYQREWAAKFGPVVNPTVNDKIDWTKPLECVHPRVTYVQYMGECAFGTMVGVHCCKLQYSGRYDRWYYRLYYSNGASVDKCSENINVKNKQEIINRFIVIYTVTDTATHTFGTRKEAEDFIEASMTPDKYYIQHAQYKK